MGAVHGQVYCTDADQDSRFTPLLWVVAKHVLLRRNISNHLGCRRHPPLLVGGLPPLVEYTGHKRRTAGMNPPPASWGRRWVQAVVQERDYLVVMFSTQSTAHENTNRATPSHTRLPEGHRTYRPLIGPDQFLPFRACTRYHQ